MKKIILAGGSGFLGKCIIDHYRDAQIVVLTRGKSNTRENVQYVNWDGKTLGAWAEQFEEAEVLINLNGKSVDCRYTEANKKLIYSTRLESTEVLGKAIQQCENPPKLWINSSSATIYRHALDRPMDEVNGEIGTGFSVDVCQQWEKTFNSIETGSTRKVAIRTAIVLGKNRGALKPLKNLARLGVGGKQGPGNQYFSWIHEQDFVNIIDFIIKHEELNGEINVSSPNPVTNEHIMQALRKAVNVPLGIPMPSWLLEFGAILIGTETELVLKSRRVVPKRLLDAGFKFKYLEIENALTDLCS
ncbi:MAG: TIGR01777 family oxidoreductase [Cyclobacteriaceae bacterium]|nr:TIGR01777 family oxidoreductase [Cyclobacteriaceae bacterium]